MSMKTDPVLLEVIRNRFEAIAEEMGAALIRTSYSTNIKDRRDCSCALFTVGGDVIAQAEHIPVHLGVLPFGVRGALAHIRLSDLSPGDVMMHNDPYIGGTHLPDIIVLAPIFYQGGLVGFVGNLAHHSDVGGMTAGSMPPGASDIFQEGFRTPPVKIQKRGKIDEELLAILRSNVRKPDDVTGDLLAQIAANHVGEKRFQELCDEFGLDAVQQSVADLEDYSDRRMAAEIEKFRPGSYTFEDALEGDGLSEGKVHLRARMTIGDGRVTFDFTGTDRQVRGPINAVLPVTMSAIYYVMKAITDPSIPPNAGTFRRIQVVAPQGCVLNAQFPAAVNAANAVTSQRLVDLLLGVVAQAMPEFGYAAATGTMNSIQIGGFDPEKRSFFAHPETYGGGYGACRGWDGASGVQTHMTNTRNAPIEVIESTLPLRVAEYGLVEDSEGPGTYRGGFGIRRRFHILADNVDCSISTDRAFDGPWGLEGGAAARTTRVQLTREGEETRLPSKTQVRLRKGDVLQLETSGGGGWGDPRQRSRGEVGKDVEDGLISASRAREIYGY